MKYPIFLHILSICILFVASVHIVQASARYDPDANDGDGQPNNDGEYYFAYGDSITRAVQGELPDDGSMCYIHQMNETYDSAHTADNNMDGASMTSIWGKTYLPSHFAGNTYFVFMFGVNDLRDGDSVGETKEQYAANMLYIHNYTKSSGSIPVPCLFTPVATNHTFTPRDITRAMELEWVNYIQTQYEKYDIRYIKMYDAVDSIPWNGRFDDYNPYYFVSWADGGWSHPNITGHKAMADFLWYFINGSDYTETYHAENDTIVVDADYNETLYITKRDTWNWEDIQVYCTTNSTYISWTQGYDNTIHFEAVKGSSYEITSSPEPQPSMNDTENFGYFYRILYTSEPTPQPSMNDMESFGYFYKVIYSNATGNSSGFIISHSINYFYIAAGLAVFFPVLGIFVYKWRAR